MRALILAAAFFLMSPCIAKADLAILISPDTCIRITGTGTFSNFTGRSDEIVFELFSSEIFTGSDVQATSISGGVNFSSTGFVNAVLDNGGNARQSGVFELTTPREGISIDVDQIIDNSFTGETFDFDVKLTFAPGTVSYRNGTYTAGVTDGYGDVTITAVPEPGTAGLLCGLGLLGFIRRKRN